MVALAGRLGDSLERRRWWLATAESCTGGYLAHLVTNVPGASKFFDRGFVTYSNRAKVAHLGVSEASLEKFGAVSERVAAEMARGLSRVTGAQACLAVTGIAGPSGGTPAKPVGTVFLAFSVAGVLSVEEGHYLVGRRAFKDAVAARALGGLLELVEAHAERGKDSKAETNRSTSSPDADSSTEA
ncbi:MAG: CinA family protein [Promethearchaeota archaeon]